MKYTDELHFIFEEGMKRTEVDILGHINGFQDAVSVIRKSPLIVIYGAGFFGNVMHKFIALENKGAKIYFTDADSAKWDTTYQNCMVIAPKDLVSALGKDFLVIVAVSAYMTSPIERNKIDVLLESYGCNNIYKYTSQAAIYKNPFYQYVYYMTQYKPSAESKFRYFTNSEHVHRKKAFQVLEILEDDFSKIIYCEYFRDFMYNYYFRGPEILLEKAYFSIDLFDFAQNERIVDCGAYTGDTLMSFLHLYNGVFECYDAFEPSPGNYSELIKSIADLPDNLKQKIAAHEAGTSAVTGSASLFELNDSSHITSSDDGVPINLCALDDVVYDSKPTLVKMDVEGAEMDTLLGARWIIKEYRPILAVSLYHKPGDLIDIPLWIKEQVPEYRLFVRKYYSSYCSLNELVLYAVPPERMKKS